MEYHEYDYIVKNESAKLQKLSLRNSALLKSVYEIPLAQAAVLLVIFQYKGRPHVILTERSHNLRTHAGDVALPGGKVDYEDKTPTETALREAEEEIGLDRKHVKIVGETLPIPSKISKVLVTTVVGFIADIEAVTLKMNKNEVSSVFATPLEFFSQNANPHFLTVNGMTFSYAAFKWNSKEYFESLVKLPKSSCLKALFSSDRTYKVWGITAMILNFYAAIIYRKPMVFSASGDNVETFKKLLTKFVNIPEISKL